MAKRDLIYDTKAGRLSLGVIAVILLVLGLGLLALSIALKNGEKNGFWQTLILGVASIVYGICNLIVLKKRKMRDQEADTDVEPEPVPAAAPISLPQEPDELIVVNPTKINDPDGSVLLYRKEGILVFDNERIPISQVVDVSMTNVSIPELPGVYHLLLVMSNGQVVHIPAGGDGNWANEAMKELHIALFGN
jgi:hypothetical protein